MNRGTRRQVLGGLLTATATGLAGCSFGGVLGGGGSAGQTVQPDEVEAGDTFGFSADIDGQTAVIGAPHRVDSPGSGAAYVFKRSDGTWELDTKLTPPDGGDGGLFGYSVAIGGGRVLVGSPFPDRGVTPGGTVHVFAEKAGWTQLGSIVGPQPDSWFGAAIDVDANVETGLYVAAVASLSGAGQRSVGYLYQSNDGTWSTPLPKKVDTGSAGAVADVAVEGDTALIGAPTDAGSKSDAGSVHVLTKDDLRWQQRGELVPESRFARQFFGAAIDIDGDTALVATSPLQVVASEHGSSLTVFERTGGVWERQQTLSLGTNGGLSPLGVNIDLADDVALVGDALASGDGQNNRGAAYVYERRDGPWERVRTLAPSGRESGDKFGSGVALGERTALVTAPFDDESAEDSGVSYWFDR